MSVSIAGAIVAFVGYLPTASATPATTPTCSADNTSIVNPDGTTRSCAPFLCNAGLCRTICTDNTACATGFVCNASTRSCLAPGAPTGPLNSGCALANAGSPVGSDGAGWAGIVGVLAVFVARRR
ncbi:MAG: hypothetical protein ACHREM_13485 [Polyangiales bacterium]